MHNGLFSLAPAKRRRLAMSARGAFLAAAILVNAILFTSCGEETPVFTASLGEYEIVLYGGLESVGRVTVKRAETVVCDYKFADTQTGGEENFGLSFGDFNFDGAVDFRLRERQSRGFVYYRFYLSDDGDFKYSPALSALGSPEFDAETKLITSREAYEVKGEKKSTSVLVSHFEGLALESVKKTETVYYTEEEIYCIVSYLPGADGSLEITDEKWLTPEKYAKIAEESGDTTE